MKASLHQLRSRLRSGERQVPTGPSYDVRADHVARYIFAREYVSDKIVLDMGCGTGYGLEFLSDKSKMSVGIDLSVGAIKFARRHFHKENTCYCVGDVTRMCFADHVFDIIISFEVIEHLDDFVAYLKEVKRLLKERGTLIISTPNKRFMSPGRSHPLWKWHKKEFYFDEFQKLLAQYFEEVKIFGEVVTTQEWLAMKKKVVTLHRYASLVPSFLIRMIPLAVLRKFVGEPPDAELHEVAISDQYPEDSWTFVAVATR